MRVRKSENQIDIDILEIMMQNVESFSCDFLTCALDGIKDNIIETLHSEADSINSENLPFSCFFFCDVFGICLEGEFVVGMLECWNMGILEKWKARSDILELLDGENRWGSSTEIQSSHFSYFSSLKSNKRC